MTALRQKLAFCTGDEAVALAERDIGGQAFELDSAHGAAAVCYGAALGGARVVGTTSSQGLLAALEQLPVQAGARVPMVLNAACEHSALYRALNTGWIILCARDAQAVYDLNFAAIKIGEHPEVRLPVLVAYDASCTRHEKRRIQIFDDADAIRDFLGEPPAFRTPLDTGHPATFGASMNDLQVSQAMEASRSVIAAVFAELEKITGRAYPLLDAYRMEHAEEAVVLLNSAANNAKDVGVLSPNVLRPFPAEEFRRALRSLKAVTIGADPLSLEVRAALQLDAATGPKVFNETSEAKPPAADARPGLPPLAAAEVSRGMAKVRRDEATGRLKVELEPLWKMTSMPGRMAPGHGACPGCGALASLHQIYKVLEGDVVALFQSGCASEVTTACPGIAHRISTLHNTGANGAATLAGLVEASRSKDITFVMITGDGAMDAGLGEAIAAANRNHRMMILEYDNQGRMSAGAQASYSTPLGHSGKTFHHRDTAQIFAACHLPYVFTATEGFPEDLMRKVAKAQWYAKNEGLVYGKILSFCPLNWGTADDAAQPVLQAALDSCFFPLYEIEHGHTTITYDPDATDRRHPVSDWLKLMGKTRQLLEPTNFEILQKIQAETDRRWRRLKAMHEHPDL